MDQLLNFFRNNSSWIIMGLIILLAVGFLMKKESGASNASNPSNTSIVGIPDFSGVDSVSVKNFGVALTIPDLMSEHAEGGFYLYFTSPGLRIRRLLAHRFDKNSVVKGAFDLSGRGVSLGQFKEAMKSSFLQGQSRDNIFYASEVEVFGNLEDGRVFYGNKPVDSGLARSSTEGNPIYLDSIDYRIQ